MKFALILIILDFIINFVLTYKLPERVHLEFYERSDNDNEIDSHQGGFSDDNEILEKEIVKNVQIIKFDINVLSNSSGNVHTEFDASQLGNFHSKKPHQLNTLKESLESYAADLLAKHGITGIETKIRNLKCSSIIVVAPDLAPYATSAVCAEDSDQIAENHKVCEAIAKVILLNFSVNELLIYYHETGYSENVSLLGKQSRLKLCWDMLKSYYSSLFRSATVGNKWWLLLHRGYKRRFRSHHRMASQYW